MFFKSNLILDFFLPNG